MKKRMPSATVSKRRVSSNGTSHALALTTGLSLFVLASAAANAADLRDPMRPANVPAAAMSRPSGPTALKLEAVMSSAGSKLAIVNGRIVRIGDTIAGATIIDISADSIRYTRGAKEHLATLPANHLPVRANPTLQAGQP